MESEDYVEPLPEEESRRLTRPLVAGSSLPGDWVCPQSPAGEKPHDMHKAQGDLVCKFCTLPEGLLMDRHANLLAAGGA